MSNHGIHCGQIPCDHLHSPLHHRFDRGSFPFLGPIGLLAVTILVLCGLRSFRRKLQQHLAGYHERSTEEEEPCGPRDGIRMACSWKGDRQCSVWTVERDAPEGQALARASSAGLRQWLRWGYCVYWSHCDAGWSQLRRSESRLVVILVLFLLTRTVLHMAGKLHSLVCTLQVIYFTVTIYSIYHIT